MFQFKRIAGMLATHALMLLTPAAIAATGDLDPAYAEIGRLGPSPDLAGTAWSLELLQDGSSLISGGDIDCHGYQYPQTCVATNFVKHVGPAGALDDSWNAAELERVEVRDAVMQPDDKLLAVGRTAYYPNFKFVAFRLASDGSLDASFGTGGTVVLPSETYTANHLGTSIVLEPDGRIVIAGYMDGDTFVLRLLANGGLDETFGIAGVYHDPAARHGVAQRIVRTTGGGYRVMTAGAGCRIVALTAAGTIDGAFGAAGIVDLESSPGEPLTCGSLTAQADGRLLVAGSTGAAGVAFRLLESGAPDPSFAADARVASVLTSATAITAGANGTILLGGSGIQGAAIMRLQADGTLDALFGDGGVAEVDLPSEGGAQPVIRDLVTGPDGEVVAAGGDFASDSSFAIRLLGDAGGESAGVLGVSRAIVEASEEDLEAVVNVRRTGGSDGSVSVAYETAAGSATADEDYQTVTGVLTWADGDSGEKQIVVPIMGAGSPEEYEDFRVTLRDAQGGAGLGTRSGTVTILPDGSPAGQFGVYESREVQEAETIEFWVYRNFFYAGEVSVTVTPISGTAIVGKDLEGQSLVLTWSDQDDDAKLVTVRILDDTDKEDAETFTIELSNATGGAVIGPYSVATFTIARNDFGDTGGSGGGGGGGGGASTWAMLLALLTMLFMRRVTASRIAQVTSLSGFLLLVNAAAWAGRGDIDPNYGEGGGVPISPSATLALPGDRLVITEAIDGGLRVRMIDAAGHDVPTFGEGGIVEIDSPEAAWPFWPDVAAHAPNGDMIFAGSRLDTGARELLRLDSDGQPVASFGDRGDGFVEPALAKAQPMAFAVDPDGRIVLAEGSWNSDFSNCEGVARIQRLLVNGQPDTGFGGDGLVEIPDLDICGGAYYFGARADGSVVVGNDQAIVAIDAAGEIDPTFGDGGRLTLTIALANLAWPRGRLLPDGGLLIFATRGESPTSNDTVFLKFDRNGQPDLNFGASGSLTVDLGADLLGEPYDWEFINPSALDPDGEHIVAGFSLKHASDGSLACSGIARLTFDGRPDTSFGRNGLTCLNFDHSLIAVQSTGAPLFLAGYDNAIHRLLPDNSPSPGLLRVHASYVHVDESDDTAIVAIERLAGRDGAVSVDYSTSSRPRYYVQGHCSGCTGVWVDSATAGSDYTATSGRLDWADGDDSEHSVNVRIDSDRLAENLETFGVDFSEPGGGAPLIGSSTTVMIHNGGQGSPTNSGQDDSTGAEGGGGSVSWATPLALLALIFIRRRSDRRAVARRMALPGLLLLVSASAWAGRGDIDPNYGEGGRVSTGTVVALPGDRLAIANLGEQGLLIRMVDATGQVVPDFGEGGSVLIDSPALGTFESAAAAFAPNGDMIFVGVLDDAADTLPRAILRLDSAGQPVASFGTRGDGFVEPALARARALAFAVDPDGKIVLGEGSWDGDVNCDSIARVQRLLADGQLDTGFGGDGIVEIPDLDICNGASIFGVRADGSVIVGDGTTIVAVDAAGEIDPAFGADGRLAITELASAKSLLLPDGRLLVFGPSTDTGTSDTVFQKYDRNGQLDLTYGTGTGSVTVDLGTALLGEPSARENIAQMVLDPDGEHLFAALSGNLGCSGIARLTIDGTPDVTFGRNGMTCLNIDLGLVAVQSVGAPLFLGGPWSDTIFRLLPDNRPSPGLLAVVSDLRAVGESAGTTTVTFGRFAGRDGAVSADFTTASRPGCRPYVCHVGSATAGGDYTATSGRLDWADGDDGSRSVTVSILDDDLVESGEVFGVDFTEPGGVAQLIEPNATVFISDNDVAPPPPPPPPPPDDDPVTSGGGGSVSWATALALLGLLLLCRRDGWQRATRIRLREK